MHSHTLLAFLVALPANAWWKPTPGTTWQIILSKTFTSPYPSVDALDGDLFDNSAATWQSIKSAGHHAICYFSAGTYENWRDDASKFKDFDLGDDVDGWEGERWLDTNSANVRSIMQSRMDLAVQKGCDAIDPDNLDAYDNDGGGLDLTENDAINYVNFLSSEGHKRGLAVGLKNAGAIIPSVVNVTDFEVNEQCQQYTECPDFRPFINNGKAVFEIEYVSGTPSQTKVNSLCHNSAASGFSTLIKHMSLDEWVVYCS